MLVRSRKGKPGENAISNGKHGNGHARQPDWQKRGEMIPISQIKELDIFRNTTGRVWYQVQEVNYQEKMVKIQAYNPDTGCPIMTPFWKKNTDCIFSEAGRV